MFFDSQYFIAWKIKISIMIIFLVVNLKQPQILMYKAS